jgi:hypothetical protein
MKASGTWWMAGAGLPLVELEGRWIFGKAGAGLPHSMRGYETID